MPRRPVAHPPAPGDTARPAEVSLRSLDIQHLTLLGLLLHECSITQVAALTGKVQPVISRALARMREVFGDPLLVRSGARMVPTERALALRDSVDAILDQVARMEAANGFHPQRSAREFRLAVADCLPAGFFPALIAGITSAGPRLRVSMRAIDPAFDVAHALQDGSIDLVVNNNPRPREDLRISALFTDEVVCLMRDAHPLAGLSAMPLARYLGLAHLAPHPSTMKDLGPVDGELAKVGYRRNIVATVPEFSLVPEVLLHTDLVFTTGRCFAQHCASRLPLSIVPAPREFPAMRFYQLWHERNHSSASNRWLRARVGAAAGALQPAAPARP